MKTTPKRLRRGYKQLGEEQTRESYLENLFDEITEAIEDSDEE